MYVGNCYVHHQVHDGVHKYFLAIEVGELIYKNFGNWRKKIWEKMHFFWELQIFDLIINLYMCMFSCLELLAIMKHWSLNWETNTQTRIWIAHLKQSGEICCFCWSLRKRRCKEITSNYDRIDKRSPLSTLTSHAFMHYIDDKIQVICHAGVKCQFPV